MRTPNRLSWLVLAISPFAFSSDKVEQVSNRIEQVVVTSTGEQRLKKEVAASIHAFNSEEISRISPSHPSDLLNRVPGVHINNLGGEGHMSSIRQPISTSAVYLFLEDGIPTRPTGFFNHNGLYEINIPQSQRIEVIKGPGSALYGSGAIGGVINTVTKPAPDAAEGELHYESGEHSWNRMLLSGGTRTQSSNAIRADLNVTENEGFRDEAAYDRLSSTMRLDGKLSDEWAYKVISAYSEIEQSGVSSLEEDDYLNNTHNNRFYGDIGFREVEALRVSAEFAYESENTLTAITPFFRDNTMQMMPSWMVTFDPNIRDYEFQSYGVLIRHRLNINDRFSVVTGFDLDYTPSEYQEEAIQFLDDDIITETVNGREEIIRYLDYTPTGNLNYLFNADQVSFSPYVHTEYRLTSRWLFSAGVRYDYFEIDYENQLDPVAQIDRSQGDTHVRPESQSLNFDELSPKLSLLYDISPKHNMYINYRHSFVSPSVGALFRPGSSQDSTELEPVSADSIELGFRGFISNNYQYEIAAYSMKKTNDIVSIIDGSDRRVVNAGETQHNGIELGLHGDISSEFNFSIAYTFTDQEYDEFQYVFQCFSPSCGRPVGGAPIIETRDFAGFDIGKAPETLGSVSLMYRPMKISGLSFELEFNDVGKYFTDETNTQEYKGHELFNLRVNHQINESLGFNIRVMNITDELYSTFTSNQVTSSEISYRPGLPRTIFAGIRASF